MKKYILLAITVVMLLVVGAVYADDLADVKQAGVLRLGLPLEYVPFVYEDDSGNTNGMDVALMDEVCRRMGIKLQTLSFARDGIIDALNLGQIDVIGGGFSKTETRALLIDYTRTYYSGEAQVIALNSVSKPATVNADTFRGMKLGVERGSSFQDWIEKNLVATSYIPASNVYTYSSVADEFRALDRKDVDMIMVDQDVYEDCYRSSGNYQVFYTGFNTENYAFGVRKDSNLTAAINEQLTAMIKDGTAQSIANRFFSMDFCKTETTINRQVATLAPVTTVTPATCVNGMSYVADVTVKDGETHNAGTGFRKTWRIYNNGSCAWNSNYTLEFVSGDRMNGSTVRIPGTVNPGQTVDVSVDLTAPNSAGNYKGYWQMRSPQGAGFGQTIWVSIKVSGSAVSPTAVPQDGQRRTIPVINYFYGNNDKGDPGEGLMVYWNTSNASGVTLSVDGRSITNTNASGNYWIEAELRSLGTHTITLTAHSVTDDSSSTIYYTTAESGQKQVIPVIDYFYANEDGGDPGEGVMVYWGTTNAGGVTLSVDGRSISNSSASGNYYIEAELRSLGTHSITLTAHSATDDATSTIYYTTEESGQKQVIPDIDYFYTDNSDLWPGDAANVYWDTTNSGAVTLSVDGSSIGNFGTSGSYSIQGLSVGTHTITLTAHSVTDDASSSIYVTMNSQEVYSYEEDGRGDLIDDYWEGVGDLVDDWASADW